MRIELNSGGLSGAASIETMQSDVGTLIGKSDTFLSALKNIKSYTYNMNGGVGSLQEALSGIESRIQAAEAEKGNLSATSDKIDSFIELTQTVDLNVRKLVTQNKNEFYDMNPWSKPTRKETEKEWYEKLYNWACGVDDAISETVQKVWNGIKSFCSSVKDKIEKWFAGFQEWWKDYTTITPTEIKNVVFDSSNTGYYGGDQMVFQSASASKRAEYYEIYIKNNPDVEMTDAQFKNYLKKLTSEGCGYVAICNTIFQQYEGRAEDFEKTFGYPMYDSNGKLNYEMLEIDMYSRMDNYDENGNYDINMDYNQDDDGDYYHYYYRDDSTGYGTTQYERKYYLEQFMSEHGVNVNVKTNARVTVTNYDNIVASGKQVIVAFYGGNLYNMDGSVAETIDGGHAMTVTGVTSDGMLIVSSWGNKYYINPAENGNTQEVGSGSNKHTIKQDMTFSTIDYE